ncbi:putative repeat protein (TIGR01451 family)/predicted secreted protein (Por secretion system target) [Flavobacterium sp. 102]|nr:putative repeat protein (TIGR01451 family)/predicted secreted protein (Por secretion system target) [Flavobacterium sp. 102]
MKLKILLILLLISLLSNAQIVSIPNANFKAMLISANYNNQIAKNLLGNYFKIDSNNDGEIQVSEALQVSYIYLEPYNIASIEGINSFTNLVTFNCTSNGIGFLTLNGLVNLESLTANYCNLTGFSITNCPNLEAINFNYNFLTNADFSSFTQLQSIGCNNNNLTSINVSGLTNMTSLACTYNQLTAIDVQGLTNLNALHCNNNQITSLNLDGLQNLQSVQCSYNALTSISLTGCSYLQYIYASYNQLTFVDANQCTALLNLSLINNTPLEAILIKNGRTENVGLNGNTNIRYVCCDDFEINSVTSNVSLYSPNFEINTYCTFVPGGTYYTIQGNNRFDVNNNGCTVSDSVYPNFKINFSLGSITSTLIPNSTGNYSIPVGTGTFTLTPIGYNPNYFNVSPTTATVTFPTQASPAIRNFCITPNGIHKDVEVILIPLNFAVPGFIGNYKLVYKNNGNVTVDGTIKFNYNTNGIVQNLVSSNPTVFSSNATEIIWNYSNLQPFETREILFSMQLNSPFQIPPVNADDQLNLNAEITPLSDDEFTPDNYFYLKQLVRNSFDPNDKTCLEGSTIPPDMVGKYVHYLIRFENTGTAEAQNIVVKDIIDTNRFDVNSLTPISGSHSFETRISNTNRVEFIFENINLPFDDATNDGYVAFKIKTKPNLVVGNSFSNSVNIYFDYNFPIVTNNYTTTIQNPLEINQNELPSIRFYPNPVKDILHFNTTENVMKITVYDVAGRIVSSNAVIENKIDLSGLKNGNYILKIDTETGTMHTKLIKE